MIEPKWLSAEIVIELNEVIVGSTGEPFQLRDEPLLESALGRPQSHWAYGGETDTVSLAVTLLFAIASNHPFVQGNKRTAFEAAILFLRLNGYEWVAPDTQVFAEQMIKVIEGETDISDFYAVFEPFVVPTADDDDEDLDFNNW